MKKSMMKKLPIRVVYRNYKHYGAFLPDVILNKVSIGANPKIIVVDGIEFQVKLSSLRLRCFKKSKVCVVCGRIGTIMSLDRSRRSHYRRRKLKNDLLEPFIQVHFNLYSEDPDGTFTLMTQDHIIPKSKGGKNHLNNLQTMCATCNEIKSDRLEEVMEVTNGTR